MTSMNGMAMLVLMVGFAELTEIVLGWILISDVMTGSSKSL